MLQLDFTLPTPAENLALDEALLDEAEEKDSDQEFLRLWESTSPVVVVGRSSRIGQEVDEAACRARNIPVLRRSSGGAAILAGPGCLMYAVVLSYKLRPELKDIRRAHSFVLGRMADALQPLTAHLGIVRHAGTSDLVIEQGARSMELGVGGEEQQSPPSGDRIAPRSSLLAPRSSLLAPCFKFSGNSLRARRTHLLYHGTLLYEFDLPLLSACLRMPPRQPDYRGARPHAEFLMNLPLARPSLVEAIHRAWPTTGELVEWPRHRVDGLVAERFSRNSWSYEFR